MAFLGNLRNVVIASFVLAILLVGIYCVLQGFDGPTFEFLDLYKVKSGEGIVGGRAAVLVQRLPIGHARVFV